MKLLLKIALVFFITVGSAQTKLELTTQGFLPLEIKTPNKPISQLVDISKSWAAIYNNKGMDIFDVTQNSITIQARVENGYYYYNVGMKYNCDIIYVLKIVFEENQKYTLRISVKEIYAENLLLKTTTADFFTKDGKLKDDFKDAKPSLENTINKIVKSYSNFISN